MAKEEGTYIRMPLDGAIASILGKRDHKNYRNVGQAMPAKSLYTLLGLTGSPMLYNYMTGKTQNIEPERAKVIYDAFGILIDLWGTPEELLENCTNKELSLKIAKEPIKEILDEIIKLESIETESKLKRGLRQLIAKYY